MYLEKTKSGSYRVMRYGGYSKEKKGAVKEYLGSFRRFSRPDQELLDKLTDDEKSWLESELQKIEAETNQRLSGYYARNLPEKILEALPVIESEEFNPDEKWLTEMRECVKRLQKAMKAKDSRPAPIPSLSSQKPLFDA